MRTRERDRMWRPYGDGKRTSETARKRNSKRARDRMRPQKPLMSNRNVCACCFSVVVARFCCYCYIATAAVNVNVKVSLLIFRYIYIYICCIYIQYYRIHCIQLIQTLRCIARANSAIIVLFIYCFAFLLLQSNCVFFFGVQSFSRAISYCIELCDRIALIRLVYFSYRINRQQWSLLVRQTHSNWHTSNISVINLIHTHTHAHQLNQYFCGTTSLLFGDFCFCFCFCLCWKSTISPQQLSNRQISLLWLSDSSGITTLCRKTH